MNKVIGFNWTAKSDDDCFHDKSEKAFATQEDCYNDMMNHAVDKMKWNIEWNDVLEREVDPSENGLITKEQTGFTIGYTLDVSPDKIVHESYSGKYTYEIIPISVPEEESNLLEVIKEWITRKDGQDGGIINITNAYTACEEGDVWEKFMEEWDTCVPACPVKVEGNLADLVLNMHLKIKKSADEINKRIAEEERKMKGARYADIHIIALYSINGETRAYTYCLGDINDCNHYFEDEESILTTFILKDKGQTEENYYSQEPVERITEMVKDALEYLETKKG